MLKTLKCDVTCDDFHTGDGSVPDSVLKNVFSFTNPALLRLIFYPTYWVHRQVRRDHRIFSNFLYKFFTGSSTLLKTKDSCLF